MIPGFILKKLGMVPEGFGKGLSNLVLYIAQPALVFLAYLKPYSTEILINSVYVLIFAIVAHVIFGFVAMINFRKAPLGRRCMLRFATIFSNAAFMGIPLIAAVLEDKFPGATLYASIYNIVFNAYLWTFGLYLCNDDKEPDENGIHPRTTAVKPMKAVLHPVTLAAVLGLLVFVLQIKDYIPTLVTDSFGMLADLVAPASMLVLGLRIADMVDIKSVFRDKYMYLFLLLRHLVLPLLVIGVFKLVALCGIVIPEVVAMVTVILAAAPSASSSVMFAEMYDCDAVYVTELVAFSTLLSIATMPLMILLV